MFAEALNKHIFNLYRLICYRVFRAATQFCIHIDWSWTSKWKVESYNEKGDCKMLECQTHAWIIERSQFAIKYGLPEHCWWCCWSKKWKRQPKSFPPSTTCFCCLENFLLFFFFSLFFQKNLDRKIGAKTYIYCGKWEAIKRWNDLKTDQEMRIKISFCMLLRACLRVALHICIRFSILITVTPISDNAKCGVCGRAFVSTSVILAIILAIIFVSSSLRCRTCAKWMLKNKLRLGKGDGQSMINVSFCSKRRCCNQLSKCVYDVHWMYSKILFCFSLTPAYAVFLLCIFTQTHSHTHSPQSVSQSVTLIQCWCERNFKHHLLDYMTEIQCGKMCEMIDSVYFSERNKWRTEKKRKRKCNELYHISCDLCAHSIRYGYLEYRFLFALVHLPAFVTLFLQFIWCVSLALSSIHHLLSSILICCKSLRYTQTHCRKSYGNFYV